MLRTTILFIATALAEIIGCFLPYLWLRKGGAVWLLLPAAASLVLFVWLLSLHPVASGRVYAAYGGVYVTTALVWLQVIDGVKLSTLKVKVPTPPHQTANRVLISLLKNLSQQV